MRGTAQAGIVQPDPVLDAVTQPFGDLVPTHVRFGDLSDGLVHGQVVVARGHQQIHAGQNAGFIHMVFMEERPARRFHNAHAAQFVDPTLTADVGVEDGRIVDEFLNSLEGEEDLDEPGIVGMEAAA